MEERIQMENMRRSSQQLQEWAAWRHKQTVEQLEKLKRDTMGKETEQCTFAPRLSSSSSRVSSANSNANFTPIKLINRKKRETLMQGSSTPGEPLGVDPDPTQPQDTLSTVAGTRASVAPSPALSEDLTKLQQQLEEVTTERDELLRERSFWLAELKEDNAKLMNMQKVRHMSDNLFTYFQKSRQVKAKLLQEIDSLERQRDRLKSLQMDVLESSLDKVLASTPLSEVNRSQLPAHNRGRADEIHRAVCTLAHRCRGNQYEVMQYVLVKVAEAEEAFVSRKEEVLESAMEELKSIASAAPGNIVTAEALAHHYPEALLGHLIEKRDEITRRELFFSSGGSGDVAADHRPIEVTASPTAERGNSVTDGNRGSFTSSGTSGDMKALIAQNNSLRASITQLRKKNAELKSKIPSNTGSKNRSTSSSLRGNRSYDETNGEAGATEDMSPRGTFDGSPPQRRSMLENNSSVVAFDDMPTWIKSVARPTALTAVKPIVRSVPLAGGMSELLLQEVDKEVAQQMRPHISTAIWTAFQCQSKGNYDDALPSSEDVSMLSSYDIAEIVTSCLTSNTVSSEAVAIAVMVLTYINHRTQQNADDDESDDESPPLPTHAYPFGDYPNGEVTSLKRNAPARRTGASVPRYMMQTTSSSRYTTKSQPAHVA